MVLILKIYIIITVCFPTENHVLIVQSVYSALELIKCRVEWIRFTTKTNYCPMQGHHKCN